MAAANTPFTGGGSTLTLGTTGVTIAATNIGGSNNSIDAVDKTDLSDSVDAMVPGDTMHHEPVTVAGLAAMSDVKTLRAAIDTGTKTIETITVTDPLLSGEATASKEESATGFITGVAVGDRVNNQIVELTVTFSWGEGSTHTNAT